ncbi:DUF6273 domain-containing protein [Robertmurraya siralis]|uniref:DUF6273 domain-containing protein n=1 Tax=Robertmurraya siralis TaxID=77777 RepID=UPI0010F96C80|nr:DUF6273 domain-containing protein [Robertmurraya siralis]
MLLSDLPVGAKVKDPETTYYGVPIVFLVAAKNHEGYPDNSVTLITEKIITLKSFDAIEPSNSDTNRRSYGNNRYLHSNIRQWLNKDTQPWYVAQHGADQPPTTANVWSGHNPYDSEKGFLANFSANFKNRILTTTLTVVKNTVTDGGGSESVQDKVFLLSNTELGLANENSIAEGSRLALFTTTDSSRLANPTPEAVSQSSYTDASLSASQPWWWWLRTPHSGYSYGARNVSSSGAINFNSAWLGRVGARPALNLPSTIRVSDNPDADGAYILRWVEISVPQGDIGIKTDKNNLLSYNITTDGEMFEVIEKVNGVEVGRKTLASGEDTQVSLTQERWNAVKFGKYSGLDALNTLTIEMDSNKWEYIFDKRLAEDANIHEIVKATKEANEIVLPGKKAKIVKAINEIGGNANDEDSLEELADKIKQTSGIFVRYASGTVTASSSNLAFQYASTLTSGNFRYVEITDLPFVPKKMIISINNNDNNAMFRTIYEEDLDPIYPKTFKVTVFTGASSSQTVINFKADAPNGVVSKELCRLPVNAAASGLVGTWEAWG